MVMTAQAVLDLRTGQKRHLHGVSRARWLSLQWRAPRDALMEGDLLHLVTLIVLLLQVVGTQPR